MRLRTFTASDMPTAMQMVREALGENAIILATDNKAGSRQVSVTAAIEEEEESSFKPITHPKPSAHNPIIDDIKFELQNILRFHNLPEILVAKLLQKVTANDFSEIISNRRGSEELFRPALEKLLSRNFVFDPLRFSTQDMRLMLVGAPGIGKTLTIAKLATKLAMDKQSLAVITTDTNRAGGIEQLQAFTSILGVELQVAGGRTELENILKSLPPRTRVLIDTAGCSPYDHNEFDELKAIAKLENIEPILVMPAGGDSLEAIDMVEIFSELPIRRLLVTRADATRRFGGVLAAAAAHGLGFCNISRSASIMDSVHQIEPALLAQMLLKYKY
jgi:flagellar biosynthesis protein FlhF